MALDNRQRAVQKIRRRKALGDDVARLHQLQRHLISVGVEQAASDDDAVLHEDVTLDQLANRFTMSERAGNVIRNRLVA